MLVSLHSLDSLNISLLHLICSSQSNSHNMSDNMGMVDPEFRGVGQKEGLRIWRIEKMAVAKIPEKDYGHFFIGDSYIVLHVSISSLRSGCETKLVARMLPS